jgi:DNA-binding GntR family transcriptional regulator
MARKKTSGVQSLEEYAYTELRDMITHGTLKAAEQLVQEDLAAKLGVSRTPLRRALANLERDNFVRLSPRGEAYVLAFGPEEIANMFEIRAVLEGLTCRLAAPNIGTKHTIYLRSLLEAAAEEVERTGDWSAYRQADIEFHTYLTELAENPMLVKLLESFQIMGLSFAQGLLRPPQETLQEHLEIIDALEAHDPDRAEKAMLTHIRKTISLMKRRTTDQAAAGRE